LSVAAPPSRHAALKAFATLIVIFNPFVCW
jgi:hypothetical protein